MIKYNSFVAKKKEMAAKGKGKEQEKPSNKTASQKDVPK